MLQEKGSDRRLLAFSLDQRDHFYLSSLYEAQIVTVTIVPVFVRTLPNPNNSVPILEVVSYRKETGILMSVYCKTVMARQVATKHKVL